MRSALVLDDTPADRDLIATVLRYAGFEVLEAATGEEAIELARRNRPALIITDLLMPEMNGYEFARALRADELIRDTPVVFCTATFDERHVRPLAEACGVSHILIKPCEPGEITRVVEEVLGSTPDFAPIVQVEQFDREVFRVINEKLVEKVHELEQINHEHRVVMETIAEGLYGLDADGKLLFMNPAASEMLGWTEDELRGKSVHPIIHFQRADGSEYPESECEQFKVRTDGRTIRMTDDAFTRKNGSIIPVSHSAAPLMNGTSVAGVVVVFRDKTADLAKQTRAEREFSALAWVARTRDALDDGLLVLYAQPILTIDGAQHSEELLVRMIGRAGEIIPPGAFLPVAEKYGLIGEVDQWVIKQACARAATGRRVEANLSAESIGNLDLLPLIEQELHDAGADPKNLVFEITETALMSDIKQGEAFARGLANIGCGLALDDFGTGFGSFNLLKTLPIQYLKIDIEFVRDLATNRASTHLVKAIVNLAQGFGLQTIAEGVENAETLELLREYGVDFAQGYYLGRPAPLTRSREAIT